MVSWFDPGDLIRPLGPHDRRVQDDGRGAALWLHGLHDEGVAIGFQAVSLVDHPPGPTDPTPAELELPRMTVEDGERVASIPALRGRVESVDGRLFRLEGVYFIRISDRTTSVRCAVVMHGDELTLEFGIADLR